MDWFSLVLEKDSYLMPVKLNDKALMDELEEMIFIFSREGKGGIHQQGEPPWI